MRAPTSFHSSIVQQDRLLPGIHGLRGIAALAVVLYHTAHIAKLPVPPAFSFIAEDFGNGVHLFFVLSASSLLHSTESTWHRPSWISEYFVKRFFRIAPLFYLVLLGMLLWRGPLAQTLLEGLGKITLNLTFTFGLSPWNGLVWAGWSVGVEMLFYALFPILALTMRTSRGALALTVASIAVALASRTSLQAHFAHTTSVYGYNWAHFSLAPNLCYFALGMYAYRIFKEYGAHAAALRRSPPLFSSILLLALLAVSADDGWKPDLILWGCGFAALAIWQSSWPSRWCANGLLEHVGERSYSVYLLHPVLIFVLAAPLQSLYAMLVPAIGAYAYFACAGLVLLPLLLLAEASYRLVEIPGIQFGRSINARLRLRNGTVRAGAPT